MDGSPPGYSVHGILQGKIMEWVPISYSWGSSQSWNGTFVSCTSCIARQILYHWATGEARPCLGGFQKPVPAALLPKTPPCPKSKEPATPRYLIPKPLLHPRVVNWDCLVWRVDTKLPSLRLETHTPTRLGSFPYRSILFLGNSTSDFRSFSKFIYEILWLGVDGKWAFMENTVLSVATKWK